MKMTVTAEFRDLRTFPEKCIGCKLCEIACSLKKTGSVNPASSLIKILNDNRIAFPLTCKQCKDAPCIDVCPEDAITRDDKTGAVKIDEDACVGCGRCVSSCNLGILLYAKEGHPVKKCDLCEGDPECVQVCPTGAIEYITVEEFNKKKHQKLLGTLIE